MGFSDKMRETLGTEGARLSFVTDPDGWAARLAAGESGEATLTIAGGSKTARVEAIILRVILRHRHWSDGRGLDLSELQAKELDDRSQLMPAWSREVIAEQRLSVERDVDPKGSSELKLKIDLPEACAPTTEACAITVHVQADIRGQIDPTATGRVLVA